MASSLRGESFSTLSEHGTDPAAVHTALEIRKFEAAQNPAPCSPEEWDAFGAYLPVYLACTSTKHLSLAKHWGMLRPFAAQLASCVFSGGQTVLMHAMEYDTDVVPTILKAGPNVDLQDEDGWTALMIAAAHHPEVVPAILAANPDVDAQTEQGWTALMIATQYHPEIVPAILAANPDADARTTKGWTALKLAIHYHPGNIQLVRAILDAGADVNLR